MSYVYIYRTNTYSARICLMYTYIERNILTYEFVLCIYRTKYSYEFVLYLYRTKYMNFFTEIHTGFFKLLKNLG